MRENSKMEYQIRQNRPKKGLTIERFLVYLILLSILFFLGYLLFSKIFIKDSKPVNEVEVKEETVEEEREEVREIVVKSEFKTIDGQSAYIAFDENAKDDAKYPVVIYSHGSTYTVSDNPNNPLTKDLDYYADIFVKNGYVFAASNQHGDNWGKEPAIGDTKKLVKELEKNYKSNGEIYLLGFSMGGLVTMNFAEKYPENIKKIALLAPTSYVNTWNATRVERIKEIPIKTWHGNKDVNVPYSMSTNLIKKFSSLGKEIEFVTVEGAGHFDIDTEYTDAIVEFYKSE